MSNTELRKQIQEDFFILDGATGSNLQKAGMKSGECPEQWILNHPDIFIDLQKNILRQDPMLCMHLLLPAPE
ncbi:MAG: hypothetical protein ACLSG9_10510 [Eubacterium sp.]